jgi:hypothetical protein
LATKVEVLSELEKVTDRISTRVQTTAVGVLALTWGLLVGDSSVAKSVSAELRSNLLLVGAAAVFVLFLDFLQYFAGYISTKKVYDEMEKKDVDVGKYDYDSLAFRLRTCLFWAKQFALMITVIVLLIVLGRWILHGQ